MIRTSSSKGISFSRSTVRSSPRSMSTLASIFSSHRRARCRRNPTTLPDAEPPTRSLRRRTGRRRRAGVHPAGLAPYARPTDVGTAAKARRPRSRVECRRFRDVGRERRVRRPRRRCHVVHRRRSSRPRSPRRRRRPRRTRPARSSGACSRCPRGCRRSVGSGDRARCALGRLARARGRPRVGRGTARRRSGGGASRTSAQALILRRPRRDRGLVFALGARPTPTESAERCQPRTARRARRRCSSSRSSASASAVGWHRRLHRRWGCFAAPRSR